VIDLFARLTHEYLVTGATIAFRKEYVSAILPIGDGWVHDGWITYIISALSTSLAIDEDLIEYRQHRGQQIGAPPPRKILGWRPNGCVTRIMEVAHAWLHDPSTRRSGLPPCAVANDVAQALVRYRSALERLHILTEQHDHTQGYSTDTSAAHKDAGSAQARALSHLRHRVDHLAARCKIRSRLGCGSRLVAAVGELWRGGYHRNGMGWLTFVRDVAGL